MKMSPALVYIIWTLLQIACFNWAIALTTNQTPNFFGSLFVVMFFQLAITLPIVSITSKPKDENN